MSASPLVSVICLCHNHAEYVKDAIQSVIHQTYKHVELIIVDDGSIDDSKSLIRESLPSHVTFIDIEDSIGNCRAFNRGFRQSAGDFLIDLAADDLLLPDRIKNGLQTFNEKKVDVEFCNVLLVDSKGNPLQAHFQPDAVVPEGDMYKHLIEQYIISAPGMMIKRDVLDELGGYDESLSYEDFDFWIRSSRLFSYGYTPEVLVNKRILNNSLSKEQFKFRSSHQLSTLRVCQKIKELNRSKEENDSLRRRCYYEIKQCIKQGNLELIPEFFKLWRKCL